MLTFVMTGRGCVFDPTVKMEFNSDRQRSCYQLTFIIFVFTAQERWNLPSQLICQDFVLVCQAFTYFVSNVSLSTPLFCLYEFFLLIRYLLAKRILNFSPPLKSLLTVVCRVLVLFKLIDLLLRVLLIQLMAQVSQL